MSVKYVFEVNNSLKLLVHEETIQVQSDHGTIYMDKKDAETLALAIIRNTR